MPNLVLAGFLLALPIVQQPGAGPRRATDDPAFAEADAAYRADLKIYDQARFDAGRGHGVAPKTHPATIAWPRMEALARGGSALAHEWLCEKLGDGVTDPARRLPILEAEIGALLACCAADTKLFAAVTAARTQASVFGLEASLRQLDRIADGSTNPEVQARALLEQSSLISDRDRTTDPAKRAQADEMRRSIVLALPTTRAGRDAAEILHVGLAREFASGMNAWLDRVAELQAAGRPASEWPPNPMHALRARYEMLAATQLAQAKSFIEVLYPSLVQAEKLEPALMLSVLASDLRRQYPRRDVTWTPIRMRVLGLGVRVGGGESPWILGALRTAAGELAELTPMSAIPFTQAVLDLSTSSEARAEALWIEASTRTAQGSEAEFLRAIEALDAIVAKHADMPGLVEKARARAQQLRLVAPGSPLPDSRSAAWTMKDVEDLEVVLSGYKGRVLLIDVFDAHDTSYAPLAAERVRLKKALAGRPFDIVGLCTVRTTQAAARASFAKLGIDWRCGLVQTADHPYVQTLVARSDPASLILVDAEGVIRARNRPFAEIEQLATELTAQAERAAPK